MNRKLLRDLWHVNSQVVAIVLVRASGIATYLMSISNLDSLTATRERFYLEYRFADVFANLERAPLSVGDDIAAIDGVCIVDLSIQAPMRIRLEGFDDPVRGLLLSLPDVGNKPLNQLYLRAGHLPEPYAQREIVLGEAFARLRMRTEHDIEMMQEMGFCQGIENYSRHLTAREPGATPGTLLDFFPDDFLCLVDESHATIPQIGGMYEGDKSRKTVLVEHGFRLPSALDNRPLRFEEFMGKVGQLVYVSATPARFEMENSVVGNTGYIPNKKPDDGIPAAQPGKAIRVSGSSESVEKFDVTTPKRPLVVEQIIRTETRKRQQLDPADAAGIHFGLAHDLEQILFHIRATFQDVIYVEKREQPPDCA